LATVVTTGVTAVVAGASDLAVVFTTGVTTLVTGATAVVVTMGVAVLVTGAVAVAVAGTEAIGGTGAGAGIVPVAFTPVPDAPVAEGLAGEPEGAPVTDDPAELSAEVAEVIVDETNPAAGEAAEEAVAEAEDVDVSGGRAAVAACAGRENNSMIAKIPAAASAACIAPRATRRTIGCMSSSTRRKTGSKTGPLGSPPTAALNLAYTDMLFGDHRTTTSPIGQGRDV
jgi:hypothetical protein